VTLADPAETESENDDDIGDGTESEDDEGKNNDDNGNDDDGRQKVVPETKPPVTRRATEVDNINQTLKLFSAALSGNNNRFERAFNFALGDNEGKYVTSGYHEMLSTNRDDLKRNILDQASKVRFNKYTRVETLEDSNAQMASLDPTHYLGLGIRMLSKARLETLPPFVSKFINEFAPSSDIDPFAIKVFKGLPPFTKNGEPLTIPRMLLLPGRLNKAKGNANFLSTNNAVMYSKAEIGSSLNESELLACRVIPISASVVHDRMGKRAITDEDYIDVIIHSNNYQSTQLPFRESMKNIILDDRFENWRELLRPGPKAVLHGKTPINRLRAGRVPVFDPPVVPFQPLLLAAVKGYLNPKEVNQPKQKSDKFNSICAGCTYAIGIYDSGLCIAREDDEKKEPRRGKNDKKEPVGKRVDRSGQLLCPDCAGVGPKLKILSHEKLPYLTARDSAYLEIFPPEIDVGNDALNDYSTLDSLEFLQDGVKPEQIFFLSLFMPRETLTEFIVNKKHIDDAGLAIISAYIVWGLPTLDVKVSTPTANHPATYLKELCPFAASAIRYWIKHQSFFCNCTVPSQRTILKKKPLVKTTGKTTKNDGKRNRNKQTETNLVSKPMTSKPGFNTVLSRLTSI